MSDSVLVDENYMLVVETNQFAGHFAEELCAYCTGYVDEEQTGREFADLFYLEMGISDDETPKGRLADEKNPFHGYVGDRQMEDGTWTPVALWASRKYGSNASGKYAILGEGNYEEYGFPALFGACIYFDNEPEPEQVALVKERAAKFFNEVYPKTELNGPKDVRVEGFRLIRHEKYAVEMSI